MTRYPQGVYSEHTKVPMEWGYYFGIAYILRVGLFCFVSMIHAPTVRIEGDPPGLTFATIN